jgi:hypothetical protein
MYSYHTSLRPDDISSNNPGAVGLTSSSEQLSVYSGENLDIDNGVTREMSPVFAEVYGDALHG